LTSEPKNSRLSETPSPAYLVEVDGSARYNPGPAGIGIRILRPDQSVLKEISRFIGIKTNNQAEYEALITALQEIRTLCPNQPVIIKTDSELVYRQLKGEYRVRDKNLKVLYEQARQLLNLLPEVQIVFCPRDENKATDKLAKSASDKTGSGYEKKEP